MRFFQEAPPRGYGIWLLIWNIGPFPEHQAFVQMGRGASARGGLLKMPQSDQVIQVFESMRCIACIKLNFVVQV